MYNIINSVKALEIHLVHITSKGSCRIIDQRQFLFLLLPPHPTSLLYCFLLLTFQTINRPTCPKNSASRRGGGSKTNVLSASASEEVQRKVRRQSLEQQRHLQQTARDKRTIITLERLHSATLWSVSSVPSAFQIWNLQSFITYNLCATTLQDCSSGTDKRETRRGRRGGERAQIFPKSSATEAREE